MSFSGFCTIAILSTKEGICRAAKGFTRGPGRNAAANGSLAECGSKQKDAEKLLFFESKLGKYQSGQMGQTVNLLSFDFGGSNPSLPTFLRLERSLVFCGSSSVDRALAFQAEGRGFEPRLPLFFFCCYSSVVEHFLGKEEVTSSSLVNSSLIT